MPPFAQEAMMRTIVGLENAKIMRHGYAVEYDYAPASQLYPSLESKKIKGLYFAGQINGTSGYEEAAAQGFIAGVNAGRKALGKEPVIIDRTEAYIGVMIDDIIHKKTPEPYRVLPSRAEYRLTLRFDNAFSRLLNKTEEIGIISDDRLNILKDAQNTIVNEIQRLKEIKVSMKEANELLQELNSNQKFSKGINTYEILAIKEVSYKDLIRFTEVLNLKEYVTNQIETIAKYETFIERERAQIEKFKKLEELLIPKDFNYDDIKGISNIGRDGLKEVQPISIGEASRISGVSGHDIALLIANIKRD